MESGDWRQPAERSARDDRRADGVSTHVSSVRLPVRRALRACLALSCVTVACVLAMSAPAFAEGEVSYMLGSAFKAEGACTVAEPGMVAVNESSGDVYVLDRSTSFIAHFSSSGTCIGKIEHGKASKLGSHVDGLAVDNSSPLSPSFGDVYAVAEGGKSVSKFTAEGVFIGSITPAAELPQIHGVAVDTTGTLWIYEGKTAEETSIESFNDEVANAPVSSIELSAELCIPRRGLAVGPGAETFYIGRSRETRKGSCESAPVAVKLVGNGETATEAQAGSNGEPAFFAQLDNESTTGFGVNQVTGQVFFDNNGTSISSFSPSGVFVQRFGDEAGPNALQAGAGVAVNAKTESVYVYDTREGGFLDVFVPKTFEEFSPTKGSGLPDGREWEQVTPLNKLGSSIYPITHVLGQVQASEDGNAITYTSNSPIVSNPPTNRAPEPSQNLSRRSATGWSTDDILPPAGPEAAGYANNTGTAYEAFSYDLSVGFVNPAEHEKVTKTEPLLSREATETTPYQRNLEVPSSSCEPVPSTCYTALVSPLNDTAGLEFGAVGGQAPVKFTSATPSGHHAVLLSSVPLTSEGVAQEAGEGLYEWETGGTLKLVSVFPAGEAPPEGELALRLGGPGEGAGGVMRNAISSTHELDGTRVIWSTGRGKERLYLRDTVKSETIRVDVKQEVKTQPKVAHAVFQTASTDGRRIFFTDVTPLTANATTEKGEEPEEGAEERGLGDLYVCEVNEEPKLGCTLKDLTTEVASANEEAGVQGVIGAGDEGKDVYFVANGSLGSKGAVGNCQPENISPLARCAVYSTHFNGTTWEPPKFIAVLSGADSHDWNVVVSAGALAQVTSRVSPNGEYIAFMSNQSLTGYNNEDVNGEGARDEEVFLYKAKENEIICASCKSGGAPPQGVFDTEKSGEGQGLIVDQPLSWKGVWLAGNIPGWTGRGAEAAIYQSRYLSDTGRLFFNSADPLVPAAEGDLRKEIVNGKETTVGVENVYEFELNGEGSCASATGCISLISSGSSKQESAFLDTSVSGSNVFFLTSQQLIGQDKDNAFDVYDARVCTPGSPCLVAPPPPPAPCSGEACKEAPTSVPAPPGMPPSTQVSAGNGTPKVVVIGEQKPKPKPKPKLTRAQKLKKALKACNKIKKKKKRLACKRAANRKYGPIKKKGKK
jgi:hypothetical protein